MNTLDLAFYAISVITFLSALGVVVIRDIVRAATALISALASVAALFVLLGSLFLSMVQLLVYAGAVTVIILFGVMFTRREELPSRIRQLTKSENLLYLVMCVLLFLLILSSTTTLGSLQTTLTQVGISQIAASLYVELRGAMYALAGLIAASAIGSIYLVKKDKKRGGGS
ncbi:hypothetical protein B9P99_03675 [Candidatus Marsarchaeota G1 archaeon OSP_B]|uniref:NADH-quinone oxidoreductase subunit J n=5 Tax=Candidatus Marsarchaeota TaxID=1978152 RepID=A0A2R6C3T7_9ARCH|nr:MAG: hypothetical protein B9Q01_01775 [Candidatus Marsarchaeota G1 archaeon OSP_D]PSN86495.1 MAG: hypothetical protein B9Q02_01950 [Candidatus Marsarchaeota G1 archaeon BE_D]PSN89190.1 MAG: hypothetical protein B9Q00_02240 [Candidatus Marsarchaeota G1 archaeon OSP_C]PSN92043.1 MAG: hypothetical protein B9P99_03675 [Candidatus Marsarchaeota G1 archaeon OSP_B]PSO05529.1 MAG: hypothetical protein B9Q12_00265 [Candidatus Marsarchaeota G2 archaeon ECH_B_SAG-G06]